MSERFVAKESLGRTLGYVTSAPRPLLTEILQLLVPAGHPAETPISGASETELERLAASFGRPLPADAMAWLRLCNGSRAGEGGILSTEQICDELNFWPALRERGWLPIAGDGCGNTYVVDTDSPSAALGFFEPIASDDELQYYLASSLPIFLSCWLQQEATERSLTDAEADDPTRIRWPFDRRAALQIDPELEGLSPHLWDE